mgnify:CR=1 FL=1
MPSLDSVRCIVKENVAIVVAVVLVLVRYCTIDELQQAILEHFKTISLGEFILRKHAASICFFINKHHQKGQLHLRICNKRLVTGVIHGSVMILTLGNGNL